MVENENLPVHHYQPQCPCCFGTPVPVACRRLFFRLCRHSRRGLFKTLTNIYEGLFWKNSWQLKVVDYFPKKLHRRCLERILNTPLPHFL